MSELTPTTELVETTEQRLKRTLSDPVDKREIAALMKISLTSVYDSLKRFTAARRRGDEVTMREEIPCIHRGGVPQANGTVKAGRYIVPRDAFIRWYTSAGLDPELLARLYGEKAS